MRNKEWRSFLIAFVLLLATTSPSPAADKKHEEGRSVTGLKIRIETPLLQESVAFYTELLDMKVLEAWDDDGDRGTILGLASSINGEAFLEIAYAETPASHDGISLQFRVDDLGPVIQRLERHWEFRGPEKRPWGSTYLYLHDPSGVAVIVFVGEL